MGVVGARYTTGRWWCWDSNPGLPHSKSSAPLYTTNSELEHQLSADAGAPLSLVPSFHSCPAIGSVALMLIDNVPLFRDPDWGFLDSQDPFLKEESHPAKADQEGAPQTPGGSTEGRPAQQASSLPTALWSRRRSWCYLYPVPSLEHLAGLWGPGLQPSLYHYRLGDLRPSHLWGLLTPPSGLFKI